MPSNVPPDKDATTDFPGSEDTRTESGARRGSNRGPHGISSEEAAELGSTIIGSPHWPGGKAGGDEGADSFLAGCAPFSALPLEVIRLIESQMEPRSFAAGEMLLRQGEPGTSLMVVCEGTVEISTEDQDGHRHFITLAGAGQVLGEMALLTDEPRSANVVARSPVQLMMLSADVFHELARQYPLISVVLTKLLAVRLGTAERDVLADKRLDAYRIRRRLGRGGMAVVYEAEDTGSGERVAVKMMSHRLVYDRAALEQFQREADIIEAFDHENIVRMLGRFKAFRTYFTVMQFCDGQTLAQVIKARGALRESEFRKILGQVARGLAYAHQAGIIHRDIKPANIMLNRDGVVKLMDFGLAKPGEDDPLLRPGAVVGTPRYMAPEQLSGEDVGTPADYFSLGCVAYEMLFGEPLFPKPAVTQVFQREVLSRLPEVRRSWPDFSDEVAELLQQSLQLDPAERNIDLATIASWAEHVDPEILPRHDTDGADTGWWSDTVID